MFKEEQWIGVAVCSSISKRLLIADVYDAHSKETGRAEGRRQ